MTIAVAVFVFTPVFSVSCSVFLHMPLACKSIKYARLCRLMCQSENAICSFLVNQKISNDLCKKKNK